MIDDVIFTTHWAILEDRFQTRHNAETAAQYLEALEAELTTEQFVAACKRAFRFNTFFPSPQEIVDHALGDFQARADDAWDEIIYRWSNNHDTLTDPDTLSRKILNTVGGAHLLKEGDSFDRRDMRKEFTRRYARALRAEVTPEIEKARALAAPALEPEADETPRPLPGLRGKAVDFIAMARAAGVVKEVV